MSLNRMGYGHTKRGSAGTRPSFWNPFVLVVLDCLGLCIRKEDENESGRDLGGGEPRAQFKGDGVTLCRLAINKEHILNR